MRESDAGLARKLQCSPLEKKHPRGRRFKVTPEGQEPIVKHLSDLIGITEELQKLKVISVISEELREKISALIDALGDCDRKTVREAVERLYLTSLKDNKFHSLIDRVQKAAISAISVTAPKDDPDRDYKAWKEGIVADKAWLGLTILDVLGERLAGTEFSVDDITHTVSERLGREVKRNSVAKFLNMISERSKGTEFEVCLLKHNSYILACYVRPTDAKPVKEDPIESWISAHCQSGRLPERALRKMFEFPLGTEFSGHRLARLLSTDGQNVLVRRVSEELKRVAERSSGIYKLIVKKNDASRAFHFSIIKS